MADAQDDKTGNLRSPLPGAVLFVCAMNAIRSPMAERLMKKHFGDRVFVQSAGVRAGEPDGFAQAVMDEIGLDMSSHQSITLDDLADDYFDLIVTLSPEAHHTALEMTRDQSVDVEYWPAADPSTVAGSRERVLDAYRETRNALENLILERFSG